MLLELRRFRALAATVALRRGLTASIEGHLCGSALESPAAAKMTGAEVVIVTKGGAFMRAAPRSFFWAECSDSTKFWLAFTPGAREAPTHQRAQIPLA